MISYEVIHLLKISKNDDKYHYLPIIINWVLLKHCHDV